MTGRRAATVLALAALAWVHSAAWAADAETKWLPSLRQRVAQHQALAVQLRRDLHRIPEACFQEERTAAYIIQFLKGLPLRVQTGIAGHGIRAILTGTRPGPVIAIRTDMDGLPIGEKTGLPFSSQHAGYSHSCGHDAHMANALVTAKILCEMRPQLPGTVVFLFQPCEEGTADETPGGAARMIAEGVMENPHIDAMLGLHLLPGLPAGVVAFRAGPMMANMAWVKVRIGGRSSHGAFPHQGIDSIYVAACAIQQFQALISRLRDPKDPAVLSIGIIRGGVRANVIADSVEMEGTVRSFSLETQDLIRRGMERILAGLDSAFGSTSQLQFHQSSLFVKNDDSLARELRPFLQRALGEDGVRDADPLTISEDYSLYSHRIPALFFFLGTGRTAALHAADFDVDETLFSRGPLLFCAAALHLLHRGVPHVQAQK